MSKMTLWIMRNSIIGSMLSMCFGQDWIERSPKLASFVKIFLYAIYATVVITLILLVF